MDDSTNINSNQTADAMINGMHAIWSRLISRGISVAQIAKNPAGPGQAQMYECVAQHMSQLSECIFTASDVTYRMQKQASETFTQADVPIIDLNRYICSEELRCPSVIGGDLVYRQGHHLTATYVEPLTPMLTEQLLPLLK
jgi:hypothetical protein